MDPEVGTRNFDAAMRSRLDASLRCVLSRADREGSLGSSAMALIGKLFAGLLAPAEAPTIIVTRWKVIEESIRAPIIASFEIDGSSAWLGLDVSPPSHPERRLVQRSRSSFAT